MKWKTIKSAAWHQPGLVVALTLLSAIAMAMLSSLLGDLVGKRNPVPGFANGFASGYFFYRLLPIGRWWRMRRYRAYAEAQRNKIPPRTSPYGGPASSN